MEEEITQNFGRVPIRGALIECACLISSFEAGLQIVYVAARHIADSTATSIKWDGTILDY